MKKLAGVLLSLLMLMSVLAGTLAFAEGGSGETVSLSSVSEVEMPANAFKGDTFTVPDAAITYGGTAKQAEATLIYPSGKARRTENNVYTLDEDGAYTVEYKADFDGMPVSETRTFVAAEHLYETTGEKAYYGTVEEVPDKPGIVTTLKEYETFTYNRLIDFTNMTKDDNLIEMMVIPSVIGECNARQVTYTFTDAEDPTNYITIEQEAHHAADVAWSVQSTFVRASSNGQPRCGWEESKKLMHKGDKWGAPTLYSMYGKHAGGGSLGSVTLSISIDYATRAVYITNGTIFVVDLDDPDTFDRPWTGFSSGKAYLTVTCGLYNKTDSEIVLLDIAGQKLSDGDTVRVEDTEAPVIDIDIDGGSAPAAVTGQPYRVFPAEALDGVQPVDVTTRVYRNYESSMRAEVEITDGAFVPKYNGVYTIEYTASDKYGNKATELVRVQAGGREAPLTITLANDGQSGYAGQDVTVRTPVVNGAIGTAATAVTATLIGSDTVYEVKDGKFMPEYAGTYRIDYVAQDYIGSAETSYEITVGASDVVRITERVRLPEYFLAGCTYALPQMTAYDYSSGSPVQVGTVISVSGAASEFTGASLVPTEAGTLTVTYTPEGGSAQDAVVYNVPVRDVGYGGYFELDKYFFGENAATTASASGVSVLATQDTTVWMIKEVLADFDTTFDVDPANSDYTYLTVIARDAADENVRLEIKIRRNGATSAYSIDGGATWYDLTGNWAESGDNFSVAYSSTSGELTVGGRSVAVTERADGADFARFPSGRVYIGYRLEGVSSQAGMTVVSISGQTFNNIDRDLTRPQAVIYGDSGREAGIGEIVTLSRVDACDVLDPYITFTMTVRGPDGAEVWSTSGRRLVNVDPTQEYEIELTQYGQYTVSLTVIDSSGNRRPLSYAINVVDSQAPVLSFEAAPALTGSVGEKVAIPVCTVTDNYDEIVEYFVSVQLPDGTTRSLYTIARDNEGNNLYTEDGRLQITYYTAFIPRTAGIYKLVYNAVDTYGNAAMQAFSITIA